MADSTSNAEVLRLQQQNALLTRLLESERTKAERAKEELIQRIAGLLGNFTTERDRSLREAFAEMTESNSSAEAGMVKLGKEQGQRLDAVVEKGMEWTTTLNKREGDLKRTRDGGFKVGFDLDVTWTRHGADIMCRRSETHPARSERMCARYRV